jgi:hypothetical protein
VGLAPYDFGLAASGIKIRARNVGHGYTAASAANGTFSILEVPAGSYDVSVGLEGFKAHPATKPVRAPAIGCGFENFTVFSNGELSGVVIDGEGRPAHRISVEAVPKGLDEKTWGARLKTETDVHGRFTIRGVPPAEMWVVAITGGSAWNTRLLNFYSSNESHEPISVRLGPSERKTGLVVRIPHR